MKPIPNKWRNRAIVASVGVIATCCCLATVVARSSGSSPATLAARTEGWATVFAQQSQTATASPTVPTQTPQPTITPGPSPTPEPSRTPAPTEDAALGLSLVQFTSKYDRLTDLQREEFIAELPGKTVDWTGTVYDVDHRGIFINMPGSVWNGYAVLQDVPDEIGITVSKGSRLHFTATIDKTINFVFFYIYLTDVEIIP